jgi:ferric-dicitrate binding protein FerR (iron transport regulator)
MDEAREGIESLLDAVIDGQCDEAQARHFEALLSADPEVRAAYLDQIRIHALLEWHHGRVEGQFETSSAGPKTATGQVQGRLRRVLAAVFLVIGVTLATMGFYAALLRRPSSFLVATLVEARDVTWGTGQPPIPVGTRLGLSQLRCRSGTLKLAFDRGAQVTLEGPADLRVLSDMRLRAGRGRITARVDVGAKGFTIETPSTLVVDQGTEFGVEVDDAGQTGVVVFAGLVDLARRGSAESATPTPIKRLGQGEGMRINLTGSLSRIVAVEHRPGDDEWSIGPSGDRDAVIRSVRDNIRGLGSAKYYQVVHHGLDDDVLAYVDRLHEWNGLDPSGLPEFLRGADYIMPFNHDKFMSDLQVTVEAARAATLYIFFDNREAIPAWLSERFADTGVDIGLDECSSPKGVPLAAARGPGLSIDHRFSVWKCALARDESIQLGAMGTGKNAKAMYGIAAVPRPEEPE